MAGRTLIAAVVALSIGLGLSVLMARRRQTERDPEWQQARSQLSPQERRAVATAVRQGRQVDDPRLRPAADAMARDMARRLSRIEQPSRWRRVLWGLLIVTTLLAVVAAFVEDHPGRHLVTIAVNALFVVGWWLLRRVVVTLSARARAAVVANET